MKKFYPLYILLLFVCYLPTSALWGQSRNTDENPPSVDEVIENQTEDSEDADVANDTYAEGLSDYLEHPIKVNRATYQDLAALGLLSAEQINGILAYRERVGKFIAPYELQAVPELDVETARRVAPFFEMGELMDFNVPIIKRMFGGTHQFFLRYQQFLEKQDGYRMLDTLPDGTAYSQYKGSPYRLYARYRHNYGNQLSYGITAEKDPGEELFGGSQPQGFDFYSAHFYMRDLGPIKHLALGDYELRLGQGLVAWTGLGFRKGSFVMNIPRMAQTVRPYTSVGEALFFRGAAANIGLGKKWEATAFGSWRKRDANLIDSLDLGEYIVENTETGEQVDGFDVDESDIGGVSSLQTSGLHRTSAELADRNAIDQYNFGGNIGYKTRKFSAGINTMYTRLSNPLTPASSPYNLFRFAGNDLLNASIDYKWLVRNVQFFGETAWSDNGGLASLNGALITLDKKVFMSVALRHYSPEYQSLFAAAFGENTLPQNEQGLFMGFIVKPIKFWTINAYFDVYRSPWLRFKTDGPSIGHDYLVQVTYVPFRELEMYARYRFESKKYNLAENTTPTDFLEDNERSGLRFQVDYKLTKALRLRSRAEFSWFDNGTGKPEGGYMLMQDLILKPLGSPFSLSTRFALFDTDSYNTRIYAYENDVLYSFSVPPYYNRGSRFYLMTRYRVARGVDVWLRYAQTFWANKDEIGTGNERINGNTKSEIKAMIRFKF